MIFLYEIYEKKKKILTPCLGPSIVTGMNSGEAFIETDVLYVWQEDHFQHLQDLMYISLLQPQLQKLCSYFTFTSSN